MNLKKEEKNSLENRNILMTGATGFLGKRIIPLLLKEKALVTTLGKTKVDNCKFIKADINDKINLTENFDLVVNLASLVPKENSKCEFKELYDVNVVGALNLFNSTNNIPFIHISTCEVYGNQKDIPISETNIPYPISDYAVTKYISEFLLNRLSKARNRELTIVRFTTLYGEDDKIKRAIPNFIYSALNNKPIVISGKGLSERDYLYVEDAAVNLIEMLKKRKSGIYNCSSGNGVKIIDLAKETISITNSQSSIKLDDNDYLNALIFSVEKAKKQFGIKQKFQLREGLKQTIKWTKQQYS